MKDKRIYTMVAAAFVFVLSAGVGTVTAYMQHTEKVMNHLTFVGENGINAVLTEPSWQKEKGIMVIPNSVIPKDPQIQNISEHNMDIMTAVKVEFLYSEHCQDPQKAGTLLSQEDMQRVISVYDIDWNADEQGQWVRFDHSEKADAVQYFYYNDVLKRNYPFAGDRTEPLFTRLYIPKEITNDQYRCVQELGGFNLVISGIILQHMEGEEEFGLSSPKKAYLSGLFSDLTGDTKE